MAMPPPDRNALRTAPSCAGHSHTTLPYHFAPFLHHAQCTIAANAGGLGDMMRRAAGHLVQERDAARQVPIKKP